MNDTVRSGPELLRAAIEILSQGEELLSQLSEEAYTRQVPLAFNASIGGHYRHCLDHFRSLADATSGGELNYDRRERGTPVETDRFAALTATRELRRSYENLEIDLLARPLVVTCKTAYAANCPQSAASSVGRELMYAVAHAVHHYALIGVMSGLMGVTLPPGFGVAPATFQHQEQSARAA